MFGKSKVKVGSLLEKTKILTDDGIQNLTAGSFKIKNQVVTAEISENTGNQDIYKVKIENGKVYYLVADHPVVVFGTERTCETKLVADIIKDDKLCFTKVDKLGYGKEGSFEAGYFVGTIITRSSYSFVDNKILFNVVFKKDETKYMCCDMFYYFLLKNKIDKIGNNYVVDSDLYVDNMTASLYDVLKQFLKQKSVVFMNPFLYVNASEEFRRGLVSALFSTDSYILEDNGIVFYSKFKSFIYDLSDFIGFYGIKHFISYKTNLYKIIIPKSQLSHFDKIFVIQHRKKKDILESLSNSVVSIYDDNFYNIHTIRNIQQINENLKTIDLYVNNTPFTYKLSHISGGVL